MLNFKDFCVCVIAPSLASNTVFLTFFSDDFTFDSNCSFVIPHREWLRYVTMVNSLWCGEWLRYVTMVNSLWCPFLWRRWIAVICEYNNGACGERFMWKRCGSFQCPWNHSSVTSRLCPREKKSSMCDRVKLHWSNETNWCPAFPLSLMCFSEFRVISFVKLRRITCVLLWIYIYMYIFVRMYWFGYRLGSMFVWLVRLWVCWVPLLVRWTHGFFCWGAPPLLYLVEQEFIILTLGRTTKVAVSW